MILLVILSFCWFLATVLGGPVQTSLSDDTSFRIPNVLLDGRKNCGVENFLKDHNIPPAVCDSVLPIDGNWFDMVLPAICFGVYDTLYELCKYQDLSSFKVNSYFAHSFCDKATKSFENYNFFPHRDPVFVDWSPRLRAVMSNRANCTDACVRGTDINRRCAIIVAALEQLPKAQATAAQSKSKAVTPSLDAKGISPSGVPKQPALPTKSSGPVLVEKKPGAAEPVVQNPTSGKTEVAAAAQKLPPADKTAPLSEAVKPEQIPKPENELPPESKVENPELEPGMIDPGAMEDDDGLPGPEPQQPDAPLEQQSDLAPPKDAPNEPNKFSDDDNGKQENSMSFPGEPPYLSISKDDSEETNMVTYFVLMTGGALLFYIAFHNKNKLLALALEGRRTGRRGGRHSSASYSKLHSNLEETIASGPTSPSATHVLY